MSARVLVIEDNASSLELMTYLLKSFGHMPFRASDGEEGIQVARSEQPDLILCDVQLAAMDGHEVCRRLKSDPVLRSIPLVALTAYAMVGDREKMLAEGFDGYLSKPVNPEQLMDQLAAFLSRRTRTVPDRFDRSKRTNEECLSGARKG
jgi:CheY-like chemotaxis protein